tara:strand:- start:14522 stop:15007 length:486 start_codon:yes stop_codon:yes gene_type:complete
MAVDVASVSAIGYFMPIFAFLLVFIVVYALLKKTEVLGGNEPIMLFISFILASFFIIETSAVEFVQFTSSWFGALVIGVFFLLAILAFMPWENPLKFLTKSDWFSWVILGAIIIIFTFSAAYAFNFVINWDLFKDWIGSDWFGFILLLIIAAVVSWTLKNK